MTPVPVPSKYEAYLQTEQFDQVRRMVFARDNYKCVVCGSTDTLQAHHLTYRNVYNEPPSDLITLCRRCHSIYHAIDRRREAVEETYQRRTQSRADDIRKQAEETKKHYERIDEVSKAITQEIKEEYLPKDYCKNGDLDMCSWNVLNAVIEAKCKQHGIDYYSGRATDLHDYFFYRRCELLLKCMDKGLSLLNVASKTKFSQQWLYKWYRRDKLTAKLNEEKEIKA